MTPPSSPATVAPKTSKTPGRETPETDRMELEIQQADLAFAAAKALASVFTAGVYDKEYLQASVCTFVAEMKEGGETGEGVVRAAQELVNDVGARFPSSERTQLLLADMVTWCLAEYYRESA